MSEQFAVASMQIAAAARAVEHMAAHGPETASEDHELRASEAALCGRCQHDLQPGQPVRRQATGDLVHEERGAA
jgi:hypothetical protein